jgi:hypothetical protein
MDRMIVVSQVIVEKQQDISTTIRQCVAQRDFIDAGAH